MKGDPSGPTLLRDPIFRRALRVGMAGWFGMVLFHVSYRQFFHADTSFLRVLAISAIVGFIAMCISVVVEMVGQRKRQEAERQEELRQ